MNPRTLWGCQEVASMISARVAPLGPLDQGQNGGGLAALTDAADLLTFGIFRGLGFLGRLRPFLGWAGRLARLPLGGRHTGLPWRWGGLRVGVGLLAVAGGGGLKGLFVSSGCRHFSFSLGGDYRVDDIHPSGLNEKQGNSAEIGRWRRAGDRGAVESETLGQSATGWGI